MPLLVELLQLLTMIPARSFCLHTEEAAANDEATLTAMEAVGVALVP